MYFDENDFITEKPKAKKRDYNSGLEMKRVLLNAIKMQALYSDGKLKVIETSDMIN
ncbi:hypothetical protein BH09PAT1_BH09PAT1_1180 [soil metagenome]